MKRKDRENLRTTTSFFNLHYSIGYILLLLYSIAFTFLSYTMINSSSQIFDYYFHMGRIIGLAQSISHGDFVPNLNFQYAGGIGYAIPMFYGNGILYPAALMFLFKPVATYAFATYAFTIILLTTYSSYYVYYRLTSKVGWGLLFAIVMTFIYPYYGFGMTAALPAVPLLVYAMYKVLYLDRLNPVLLGIVIAFLVQTHIISTIALAIFSVLFVLLSSFKFTWKKLLSFFASIVIAVLLSSGFILQYLEQKDSQVFFVDWLLRSFPFPSVTIVNAGSLIDIAIKYRFPLALFFLIIGLILIPLMKSVSRVIFISSALLFVGASNAILPWQSVLRYTFLAVFQYTERLIYFIPALVVVGFFFSEKKWLMTAVAIAQILFFYNTVLLPFSPDASPYAYQYGLAASNAEVITKANETAFTSFQDPLSANYTTSGDEYFNLSIDHEHVRNGEMNKFDYNQERVTISDVKQGYNVLEFDVELHSPNEEVLIYVPRTWYKGYVATYTGGASGTAPAQETVKLTSEEKAYYRETYRPNVTEQVLKDGRAAIKVKSSGHVRIEYQKTMKQKLGFTLQNIVWGALVVYCFYYVCKPKLVR